MDSFAVTHQVLLLTHCAQFPKKYTKRPTIEKGTKIISSCYFVSLMTDTVILNQVDNQTV